ncbi:uncharacterized protein LOC8271379 [Ricinus communis]|uniref:Uncharacterized protein n=1 Tax=Ricinus communis TaxID=3988 RepID=B9RUZ7_RICCO|nr:uncharacterized protein LOC8271379 [Ricinus communis]EEF44730.1 conserved hypothetical protein [Ricinus communis]|eukprot:XP_015573745.1 uncharacterized protein LOC8271379 [Ricinus communis]
MASTLVFNCSLAAPIRASSRSARKPDPNSRKTASSTTWWAPLFGWSSDPDYINTGSDTVNKQAEISESESGSDGARSKFSLGCFTEEKARQLRKKTAESSSFHDIMYHSAIASRLASDISGRSGNE